MSRAVIYKALKDDIELQSFWNGGIKIYPSNATDSPIRTGPFIVISHRDRDKAFGLVGAEEISIWAHMATDLGKDYTTIDAILERCKEIITALVQVQGMDGWQLSSATWLGNSGDLLDDGYKTLTKNASFRVASRYVSFVALG